ncbi:hypothetical protein [Flexivirga oryzae]|uniref:CBS domain-containing protein n=1 Tax=Flexivirga oryzae TaxID=1794944 RepID=A0A839NBW5_9MICO|nr:hypothetical protein [Flexivirga oryzae]MBB2893464.1 hypothetical protein [Flexivirga oryzae]
MTSDVHDEFRARRVAPAATDERWSPFVASQLSTSLEGAVSISISESCAVALDRLVSAEFDQAPVHSGGETIGWVHLRDLKMGEGTVEECLTPLSRTPIVAATTSLSHVLPAVRSGFVFTVHGAGLSGFVVPSDLDRHAVRGHFYLTIAEIEMCLSDLVGAGVPDANIEALVCHSAGAGRFKRARKEGKDTRIVEYLDLRDLLNVYANRVDLEVPERVSATMDELPEFRNVIMHATKPLVVEYPPQRLADLDARIRELRDYVCKAAEHVAPRGWFGV